MEYCFPLWADSPASHIAQLDAVETKAFKLIGISRNETELMDLSFHHRRQVGGLSVFYHLLSGFAPSALSVLCAPFTPFLQVSAGHIRSTTNPHLVKLPIFRITAHLHSFAPLFLPACGTNFYILFNLILPFRSSKQLFITISDCPQSKTMIFSTLINTPNYPTPIPLSSKLPVFPS